MKNHSGSGLGTATSIFLTALLIWITKQYLRLCFINFINFENKKDLDVCQIEKLLYSSNHKSTYSDDDKNDIEGLKNLCIEESKLLFQNMEIPAFTLNTDDFSGQKSIISASSMGSRMPTISVTTTGGMMRRMASNTPESEFLLDEQYFFDFIMRNYLNSMWKSVENCDEIKISFGYFLHDFMDLGREAYTELLHLKQNYKDLKLENQIDVMRLDRILREKESERRRKEGKLDIEGLRVVDSLKKMLQESIKSYNKFWLILDEKDSETFKVRSAILESFFQINGLRNYFERNEKIFENDVGSLLSYGNFVSRILNMSEQGSIYLRIGMNLIKKISEKRNDVNNFGFDGDVGFLSAPVCLMEKIDNELRTRNCNAQFSFLFGYSKVDLIKNKSKKFLSKKSVKYYLKKFDFKQIEVENKQYFGFNKKKKSDKDLLIFKTKGGFLRVYLGTIKIIRGEIGEKIILLKLEVRKYTKLQGNIVATRSGRIIKHNEEISRIFSLDNLYLKKLDINYLSDLVPKFEKLHFHEFFRGKKIVMYDKKSKKMKGFYVRIKRPSDFSQAFVFSIWRFEDMDPSLLNRGISKINSNVPESERISKLQKR